MKKLSKKLSLNKETLTALTNDQMMKIRGGDTDEAGRTRSGNNPTCYSRCPRPTCHPI